MEKQKLIIVGSGPSGFTAAIYAARAGLAPLVFEGSNPGGQLMGTSEVENFPGFPDGILGAQLMANMRTQAQKFGAKTEMKVIDRVDFDDAENLKLFSGSEEFVAESVIIATGASARWLNLGKGEEKFWGKGYTACATCDGAFFRGKTVAVIGGGDTACEEAHFLTRFADKVFQIYRGPQEKMRASLPMQQRVQDHEKIELIFNKTVTELRGEPILKSVELTDTATGETSELELDGLFMAIGHDPNTKFLGDSLELEKNYIRPVGAAGTKIPSVFVAGDVVDFRYQQAITAAGHGCQAAMDAEHYLGNKS
ncbi:thioredoxin-disulfide reductase [bacterium]|jgi:thioredoxin reductase (NADPH)|nr:thioredoxin-disulfide reductase [bacterium]MBT6832376.1 thioredoxin-disulfide reductase [bacterium]MBT6995921.1 thioredoxin-disulfide reductase [bacterium]MBT7772782.1 thioredoxin-disulfide reductase [bacterium]